MRKVSYQVECALCGGKYRKGCLYYYQWAKPRRDNASDSKFVCKSCIKQLVRAWAGDDGIEVDCGWTAQSYRGVGDD